MTGPSLLKYQINHELLPSYIPMRVAEKVSKTFHLYCERGGGREGGREREEEGDRERQTERQRERDNTLKGCHSFPFWQILFIGEALQVFLSHADSATDGQRRISTQSG